MNHPTHKLDITFNDRFLLPSRQPTIIDSIWKMKVRTNVRKANHRRLPIEEKRRLYLESRPMKRKLLDWVGSKSRALVRTMGTVDAWAGGPPVKHVQAISRSGSGARNVRLLGSGPVTTFKMMGLSERTKRVITLGMIVSMGGLLGWAIFGLSEQTRAEGPVAVEPERKKKMGAVVEERERLPGVFVWGSNRFVSL